MICMNIIRDLWSNASRQYLYEIEMDTTQSNSNLDLIALNNHVRNKIQPDNMPVHDWYRFVLSFPPHLVKYYIEKFGLNENSIILDPFCGTGTTVVESKLSGIGAIGIEAHPMAYFASKVKTNWKVDPDGLVHHAEMIANKADETLNSQGIVDVPFFKENEYRSENLETLSPEKMGLLLKNSISPLPLHKALLLLHHLTNERCEFTDIESLAFAKSVVQNSSNLKFGPEVGVGVIKKDVPVIAPWLSQVKRMAEDLRRVHRGSDVRVDLINEDSRTSLNQITAESVDAVITSPPYPNEKDYTRTTRLESVMLGFINDKQELQNLKKTLLRSNTRGIYKYDDDDSWISDNKKVNEIADQIEKRRIELGKTSGFERMYPRVTKLYFGGMAKHLKNISRLLKPGAKLAYVVGDQASYLRVVIKTGELLAEIADSLGYEVVDLELFRTRFATATKEQIREEVLLLRWPQKGK